jgi:hypothetical protein
MEMAVALHRFDQQGRERLQPLATDPIRRLPEHDQRLADGLVIDAPFRTRSRAPLG